jgi:hypothetical protein
MVVIVNMVEAVPVLWSGLFLQLIPTYLINFMPHKMFIKAYETGPIGFLITIQKAVLILLAYKIRDARFQGFLLKWAAVLLILLSAGFCGFNLLPIFLAMGAFFPIAGLYSVLLWIGAGDIFLKFALEDEGFYQVATQSRALSIFEDTDSSLPQATD